RQVYRGMDIGTGKDLIDYNYKGIPIPYHLIDIFEPMEEYNVSQFQQDCQRVASEIHARGNLPILCGGTGFYLKAILLDFQIPSVNPDKKLRAELENLNLKELINKLESISPGASKITKVDTKRRVIRAIEIHKNRRKETGERGKDKGTSTSSATGVNEHRSPIPNPPSPLVIGIDFHREVIRERITNRLHHRINNGMIEEVESLLKNGVTHERMDILGLEYRFISRYLSGKYEKEEMISLLNTAIHQFAKKQMTFFRNMEKNGVQIHWISEGNVEMAQELVKKFGF
ncbi:MAG: tRNA (adenosine(37)-N6)-dimethylallyltransferase MiaA, partial [Candidatus Marinimicrobia bacterium]|nr:tRNA (adenosine(37)-N6)-dimethylallyltransferase MiaA [Candidatus Neomarinimicrobiota bacterium]